MKVTAIDHVEFCVADAEATATHLCEAFGFQVHGRGGPESGRPDERTILLRQGSIQLLLRAGLTAEHPAARYVRQHGAGVSSLGFSVDDVAAAFNEAVKGGATGVTPPGYETRGGTRVGTASAIGFGDVLHTFIERDGPADEFWPGLIDMTDPGPVPGEPLLEAVDHIAVCLPAGELDPSVQRYGDAFGLSQIFDEYIQVGGQAMISKVVQDTGGAVTFTLIEPDKTREAGQIDEFLEAHDGAGVQHVAFRTRDIVGAVGLFSGRGIEFLTAPDGYYRALEGRLGSVTIPVARLRGANVLADRDRWGMMYQIFAKSAHQRNTFFFELIERQGALTFGSKNIQALYEALEDQRQLLAAESDS